MNKDILKGQWAQFKGKVKEQWGKLTDDDLTAINGKREVLLGKLQTRYGYAKDRAERELTEFEERCCTKGQACSSHKNETSKDFSEASRRHPTESSRDFSDRKHPTESSKGFSDANRGHQRDEAEDLAHPRNRR